MNANCDHTMTEVMHRGENSQSGKELTFLIFFYYSPYLFAFKRAVNEALPRRSLVRQAECILDYCNCLEILFVCLSIFVEFFDSF